MDITRRQSSGRRDRTTNPSVSTTPNSPSRRRHRLNSVPSIDVWASVRRIGRTRAKTWRKSTSAERTEEHKCELQSLMRNSDDVFCLKTKTQTHTATHSYDTT